jgi:hypothetical protein
MKFVGNFILPVAREAARIYLAAALASRMIKQADKQWEQIVKEGSMHALNAESVNLVHLGPELVSYEPKGIHTEALQVTPENIGKLSLEFEKELVHDSQGRPYFFFPAERFDSGLDDIDGAAELFVRLTDWIVPLRGEIHIFRDVIFRHTFTFDNPRVAEFQATSFQISKEMLDRSPTGLHNVKWDNTESVASRHGVYPTTDSDDMNLMDAARSSSKPELRALAEKLSKPLPRAVRVKGTGDYGVVESPSDHEGRVWVRMRDTNEPLEFDAGEIEFVD